MSREAAAEDVGPLVEAISPILAGKPPQLQGAVLADLLAIFLAGHPAEVRGEVLALHVSLVLELVAPNVAWLEERERRRQ